jgi:hypothetical protein
MAGLPNLCVMITLNPWFVTGYTDAEGCFTILIVHNSPTRPGGKFNYNFEIGAVNNPANRRFFLESLVVFFGGGQIRLDHKNLLRFVGLISKPF